MKNNRIITKDENVTTVDFEGVHNTQPLSRRTLVKRALAGAALVGAVAYASHGVLGAPAQPKRAEHSISYLDHNEMETGVIVQDGDNPTELVDVVNGGHDRLNGQAEIDAAQFVQRQGSGVESDGKTPELHPGDMVRVPVLTDEQIRIDNNGGQPG